MDLDEAGVISLDMIGRSIFLQQQRQLVVQHQRGGDKGGTAQDAAKIGLGVGEDGGRGAQQQRQRLQEELKAFLKETVPILPSRELTLYDSAVVSRGWEQKRLRQLYDLASSNTPIQIFSWEALSQRTMPPKVLLNAAFRLETGKEYQLDDLLNRLTASGYCP